MPVMKNDNDLHGNRVVRSDDNNSNQSTAGTEQYRASRKEQEKESAKQAVQKSGLLPPLRRCNDSPGRQ